ncbi:hypothetical protein NC651_033471 [Populus alba x Populus x berolinensis]|nr:hypothetical protein NC651_033471 [Populus alba x Populus x berolinensis]
MVTLLSLFDAEQNIDCINKFHHAKDLMSYETMTRMNIRKLIEDGFVIKKINHNPFKIKD